jgi:hypothetical protein
VYVNVARYGASRELQVGDFNEGGYPCRRAFGAPGSVWSEAQRRWRHGQGSANA